MRGILSQSQLSLSEGLHYVLRERGSERHSRIARGEWLPRKLQANWGQLASSLFRDRAGTGRLYSLHSDRLWSRTIERSPKGSTFAVGYADGSIRLWDVASNSVVSTFNGHKRAITALAFDDTGTRLASGSQDTDLILWDVIGEAGLFRFVIFIPG